MSSDTLKKITIGQRIRRARTAKDLTQTALAQKIGITQQSWGNYEKGKNSPSLDAIQLLVVEHGVNADWLLTGEGQMFESDSRRLVRLSSGHLRNTQVKPLRKPPKPRVQVPIYGVELGAGAGAEPSELIVGYGQFFERWLRQVVRIQPEQAFICAVRGDSMTELFEDGDLVLGQFIDDPGRIDREGVYAVRHQGDLLIKRLRIGFDHLTLLSESDAHPNISVQPNAEDFEVIGQIERKIVRLDLPV